MKTLENILHLYLDCDVMVDLTMRAKLIGYQNGYCVIQYYGDSSGYTMHNQFNIIKPILRPLDSMTEEEAKDIWDKCMPNGGYKHNHKDRLLCSTHTVVIASPLFPELLSKSFDLFGLIDSGLALDATKLEGYAK